MAKTTSSQATSGAVREYEWARFAIPEKRPAPKRLDGTPYRLPPLLEPQPDHEWRVIRHWGSDGEEYRFEYNLEAGETLVTDNLGRRDHYYWGPLYEVYKHIDPQGNCWLAEVIAGQLIKRIDPQGGEWRYSYDDIGRLIETCDPLGRREHIKYLRHWALPIQVTDTAGRTRQYGYDSHGNLLWQQDPLGRETQYQYDPEVLPDQRELNHLYYGSGHLHQINLNGRVISDFERDAVHDEVLRTQGKLVTRTRYDTSGRLAGKAIHYRDAPAEVLPLLDKAYRYDASDNLIAEVLTQIQRRGMTNAANDENAHLEQIIGRFHDLPHTGKTYSGHNRYGYDLNEQLQTVQQSRPNWQATQVEDFKYDKAGNLFDGPKLNGLIKHNRVLVYQDKRYRYDRFGRLCEKRIGSNWVQYFEYDAEQRLVCVEQ